MITLLVIDTVWLAHALWTSRAAPSAEGAVVATSGPLRAASPAQNPAAVTAETMQELQALLEKRMREAPARSAAVFVEETQTGLTAGVNADRRFVAASLIKLPVMGAAFELWERRPEKKTTTAMNWLDAMITVSDNRSTDRMLDVVGGPRVATRFCASRGWDDLEIAHGIYSWRISSAPNVCTARETVELLAALDRRELVSPAADAEMWEILCRQQKRRRIPSGIPDAPGVEVGNKTGSLDFVLHDAGIVRTPRTRFALCILLRGQRGETAGNRFCREITRLVFDTLHGPVDTHPAATASATAPERS